MKRIASVAWAFRVWLLLFVWFGLVRQEFAPTEIVTLFVLMVYSRYTAFKVGVEIGVIVTLIRSGFFKEKANGMGK
jgi:hypothetical protein